MSVFGEPQLTPRDTHLHSYIDRSAALPAVLLPTALLISRCGISYHVLHYETEMRPYSGLC